MTRAKLVTVRSAFWLPLVGLVFASACAGANSSSNTTSSGGAGDGSSTGAQTSSSRNAAESQMGSGSSLGSTSNAPSSAGATSLLSGSSTTSVGSSTQGATSSLSGTGGPSSTPQSSSTAGTASSITTPSSAAASSSSGGSGPAPTTLLFSEYVEGTSNNKAIEIVNGTGAPVALDAYTVSIFTNGAATASNTLQLSGVLVPGATLAICNGSAVAALKDRCTASAAAAGMAVSTSAVAAFNGDDSLLLERLGVAVDRFGDGSDPGTAWGTAVTSVNQTLRRNCSVVEGWLSPEPFDPAAQWTAAALDDFSNVGSWHCASPAGASSSTSTGATSMAGATSSATSGASVASSMMAATSSTAPSSSMGVASSTGTSGPSCGDGVVTGSEACDLGIAQGQPGACPRECIQQEACTARTLVGGFTCNAHCVDSPITATGVEDMCCADAQDPDCLRAYPVGTSSYASSQAGGRYSCVNQRQTKNHTYLPMPPTSCGQPAVVTIMSMTPGFGGAEIAAMNIFAHTLGGSHMPGFFTNNVSASNGEQTSFLVGMSQSQPSFFQVDGNVSQCNGTTFSTTLQLDARPVSPVTLGNPAADGVWLATDSVGHQVLTRANGVLTVTSGRLQTGWFANGVPGTFTPESWTQLGAATVASGVGDVDVASEPTADLLAVNPSMPSAHVVWTNAAGTELRYARVSGTAVVGGAALLRSGSMMAKPRLVLEDQQHLAFAWVEGGSLMLARFAPLPSGPLASPLVLASNAAPVEQPALAVRSDVATGSPAELAVAWVDSAAGTPQLHFQRVSGMALVPLANAEVVSLAAVEPASPSVEAILYGAYRVTWADRRLGHSAVFTKDNVQYTPPNTNVPGPFAANTDQRLSNLGVASHSPRVWPMPGVLTTATDGSTSISAPLSDGIQFDVVWTDGPSGAPMFAQTKSDYATRAYTLVAGFPMRLSCGAALDARLQPGISAYTRHSGAGNRMSNTRTVALWLEGGEVHMQSVRMGAVGRQTLP